MTLKDLIDKLMCTDGLVIVVDDHGNATASYVDDEHFNKYQNCEVEKIRLAEYEIMFVTIDGSSKGE